MTTKPSEPPPETKPSEQPPEQKDASHTGSFSKSFSKELIREFFHEFISRVIPGLVILALYQHKYAMDAFAIFCHSPILLGTSILVAAWLIGVILDNLVFAPFALMLTFMEWLTRCIRVKWPSKCVKWLSKCVKSLCEFFLPKDALSKNEQDRRLHLKDTGERVMFRGMIIICLFTKWVMPPTSFVDANLWRTKYWLYGSGMFFIFWLWAKIGPKCASLNRAQA
jgi:hypothetical protein